MDKSREIQQAVSDVADMIGTVSITNFEFSITNSIEKSGDDIVTSFIYTKEEPIKKKVKLNKNQTQEELENDILSSLQTIIDQIQEIQNQEILK